MKSHYYFDPTPYVDGVIKNCKLQNISKEDRDQLENFIETRLSEKVIDIIVDNMSHNDMTVLKNIQQDHPELDEFDAIMMIVSTMPGIQEKLFQGINELFEELVSEGREIQKLFKNSRS